MVPSEKIRDSGHKLQHNKLHLNVGKNLLPLNVTEHWTRVPKEAVESPLERSKTHLDIVILSNLFQVTLL